MTIRVLLLISLYYKNHQAATDYTEMMSSLCIKLLNVKYSKIFNVHTIIQSSKHVIYFRDQPIVFSINLLQSASGEICYQILPQLPVDLRE